MIEIKTFKLITRLAQNKKSCINIRLYFDVLHYFNNYVKLLNSKLYFWEKKK